MSEMGLEKKGGLVAEGAVPDKIDAGMPAGGSPGDGELAPWPVDGGVIGANSTSVIK
jgi:hypothetical protein